MYREERAIVAYRCCFSVGRRRCLCASPRVSLEKVRLPDGGSDAVKGSFGARAPTEALGLALRKNDFECARAIVPRSMPPGDLSRRVLPLAAERGPSKDAGRPRGRFVRACSLECSSTMARAPLGFVVETLLFLTVCDAARLRSFVGGLLALHVQMARKWFSNFRGRAGVS